MASLSSNLVIFSSNFSSSFVVRRLAPVACGGEELQCYSNKMCGQLRRIAHLLKS